MSVDRSLSFKLMYTDKAMFSTLRCSLRYRTLLTLLIACLPLHAQTQAAVEQERNVETDTKLQKSFDNLANIQQSIELKRSVIRERREQLKRLEDISEKQELEQRIIAIKNDIANLQLSFEHIVLGGINQSILSEQPEEKINWQDEIEQISRPLLSTLKELTAKPRQIDSLHREIERLNTQVKVIDKALASIRNYKSQALPANTIDPVNQLLSDWEQRRDDTQRMLELSRYKLTNLVNESTTLNTFSSDAIVEFIRGRGLTLFLAIVIGLALWLLSKGILQLYWRWLYQTRHDIGLSRAPLFYYSYRLTTGVIIVLSILMVFYVRGDVLFLTLALIALAGAALTLRQTLPRYAAEIRLLLGVGPTREEERIVLDGIPFRVDSLSVFSVMRNPSLEGIVRLPLHEMNTFTSRPAGEEPWFPCQPGDYLLLANGSFGRVLRQTIEMVEIAVLDSVVQIRTGDFIGQNNRNLSRNGFGISNTFGIDYQHQAICLDTVPSRFRESIINRFEQAGLKEHIKDILVEFKDAGTSSLDYHIYIIFDGQAANAFYRAQRMVQQACVETCNREGWIIPFTQITVHSGQASETLEQLPGQTESGVIQTPPDPSSDPQ